MGQAAGRLMGAVAPVQFGAKENDVRLPFVIQQATLSKETLEYLLEAEIFKASERELVRHGFHRTTDRSNPKHISHEAHFHTLPTSEPAVSIDPRSGMDFDKPAAPLQLRAFAEAFRRLNDAWIREALKGDDATSTQLRSLFEQGSHFADLTVQMHWGDEVSEDERLGWHKDSLYSALHMAVELQGRRALHIKAADTPKGLSKTSVHWQAPGVVAVSSPCAFQHGVQYEAAENWQDRIISLQFKFLIQQQSDLHELVASFPSASSTATSSSTTTAAAANSNTSAECAEAMAQVARVLARLPIQMPDLKFIQTVERELAGEESVRNQPSQPAARGSKHQPNAAMAAAAASAPLRTGGVFFSSSNNPNANPSSSSSSSSTARNSSPPASSSSFPFSSPAAVRRIVGALRPGQTPPPPTPPSPSAAKKNPVSRPGPPVPPPPPVHHHHQQQQQQQKSSSRPGPPVPQPPPAFVPAPRPTVRV